jgi:DNA polymerase V
MNILNYTCTAIVPMPLMAFKVQAGFPSPADDYMDKKLDLNEYLITHPNSTFFVRATGESMIDAGIMEGSLLVVDKSIKPTNHKIVIAVVNEEFTVKRLKIVKGQFKLISENSNYHYDKILSENDFIWGVVIAVINKL